MWMKFKHIVLHLKNASTNVPRDAQTRMSSVAVIKCTLVPMLARFGTWDLTMTLARQSVEEN